MALSALHTKGATAAVAATGLTATFDATATAGNLLVAMWSATVAPGTITGPSGWTQVFSDAAVPFLTCWYKVAAGSETSCVVGTGNSVTQDLFTWEVSGFRGTPTLGRSIVTNAGGSTVTTASTGTTAATTRMESFGIATVALNGASGGIVTPWTNGYTDDATRPSTRLYIATRSITAMAAQETTLAWTSARRASAGLVTFRDSAADGFLAT